MVGRLFQGETQWIHRRWNILSIRRMSSASSCGHDIQRNQVSYVAHVTPIPENLDSEEAASFLCAVRITRLY